VAGCLGIYSTVGGLQGTVPSNSRCPLHPSAPADGRPFISLRVFDWDLVSADDFLGQCEAPFADLDPQQQGPSQPTWLPLYGVGRGGKREDAGEVQVAIWFQAGSGGAGQEGEEAGSSGWAGPACTCCWLCSACTGVHAACLRSIRVCQALSYPPLPPLPPGHLFCRRQRGQHAMQPAWHPQARAPGGSLPEGSAL
jgi:hypothetical protein